MNRIYVRKKHLASKRKEGMMLERVTTNYISNPLNDYKR
jgi:hypothetical protein